MKIYLNKFKRCYSSQDPNNANSIYFNRNRKTISIDSSSKTIISSLINTSLLDNKYDFYNRSYDIDYPEISIDSFGTQKNSLKIRYNNKFI